MSVPDTLPRWATDGSAEITEPPEQQKDSGWTQEDIPPHQTFNWFWNLVYQWIAHLAGASAKYTALEDAVDGLAAGDTAIVDEYDLDQRPGALRTAVATWTTVYDIVATGDMVLVAGIVSASTVIRSLDRATLATTLVTYTRTNAGTPAAIAANGQYVALAYGQYVELFNQSTGASVWVHDHGATVYDVAMDGTRVYLVGEAGTGTKHARAVNISGGATAWSYQHTATGGDELLSVAADGVRCFVMGDASSYASGATLRALVASSGADALGEGGIAADTTGVAWDAVQADIPVRSRVLETDGRHIYIGYESTAAQQIEARGVVDGDIVGGAAFAEDAYGVAVDQHNVYVSTTTGASSVRAYDKRTWGLVWQRSPVGGVGVGNPRLASDGCAVFNAGTTAGTGLFDESLMRLRRGNRPKLWRRVSPTDNYLPYRQLIIPEE